MHIRFCSVEIGKPLFLVKGGNSNPDKGEIKTFNFDSRNLRLIDDAYDRALSWLNQMQGELDCPQFDEIADCTIAVIIVNKGVLSAFYSKDEFWKAFFETFDLFETKN